MGKPRADSKLKTLSEEQQEQIVEWLRTPKSDTCPGGQKHALEQIKLVYGITTSKPALTAFLAWWELQEDFSLADTAATFSEEMMLKFDPNARKKAEEYGHFVFENLAIKHKDPQTFVALQRLKLDKASAKFKAKLETDRLSLDKKKFQVTTCELFLEWSDDAKAKAILNGSGSNAEKIEQLGRAMFGEDWEN